MSSGIDIRPQCRSPATLRLKLWLKQNEAHPRGSGTVEDGQRQNLVGRLAGL